MITTVWKRLAVAVPVLLVVSALTFAMIPLLPGDPARTILGQNASADQIASLRERMGLDEPVLQRYLDWIGGVLRGDLGVSYFTGAPVAATLGERMPVTFSLAIAAAMLSLVVGVTLGVLAALRGGPVDAAVRPLSVLGMSMPNFWLALLLVSVFAVQLQILPAAGYVPFATDPTLWLRSLTLPALALATTSTAAIALQTRTAMIGYLHRDFVRMLRAKGVPTHVIVTKHLLRNASGPVVSVFVIQFVAMIGSAVVIEQVFSLPGLGSLAFESVNRLDMPVMQGVVLFMTLAVLVINLAGDILGAWLNPKVREG